MSNLLNKIDAIHNFNQALRRMTSECGIEEVARKTNAYLKTLPTSYGVWELDMIMTPSEAKREQENLNDLKIYANSVRETAKKKMEARIAEGYYGINYGSEVTSEN